MRGAWTWEMRAPRSWTVLNLGWSRVVTWASSWFLAHFSIVKAVFDAFWRVILCLRRTFGFQKVFPLKECSSHSNLEGGVLPQNAIQTHHSILFAFFTLQGTRVWLRENGQHFPSTVNSCAEGVVVFRTDYGQVSTSPVGFVTSVFPFLREAYTRAVCSLPCSPNPKHFS